MINTCLEAHQWAQFFDTAGITVLSWTYDMIVAQGERIFTYIRDGQHYCIVIGEMV